MEFPGAVRLLAGCRWLKDIYVRCRQIVTVRSSSSTRLSSNIESGSDVNLVELAGRQTPKDDVLKPKQKLWIDFKVSSSEGLCAPGASNRQRKWITQTNAETWTYDVNRLVEKISQQTQSGKRFVPLHILRHLVASNSSETGTL